MIRISCFVVVFVDEHTRNSLLIAHPTYENEKAKSLNFFLQSFSTIPTKMKTTDEAVPDQLSVKPKNDETYKSKNLIISSSIVADHTKTTLITPKNTSATTQEKYNVNQTTTTVVTLKFSFEEEFSSDNNLTQQTIAVASTVVINNNRITTPITLQFRLPKDTASFNVTLCRCYLR